MVVRGLKQGELSIPSSKELCENRTQQTFQTPFSLSMYVIFAAGPVSQKPDLLAIDDHMAPSNHRQLMLKSSQSNHKSNLLGSRVNIVRKCAGLRLG